MIVVLEGQIFNVTFSIEQPNKNPLKVITNCRIYTDDNRINLIGSSFLNGYYDYFSIIYGMKLALKRALKLLNIKNKEDRKIFWDEFVKTFVNTEIFIIN